MMMQFKNKLNKENRTKHTSQPELHNAKMGQTEKTIRRWLEREKRKGAQYNRITEINRQQETNRREGIEKKRR